MKALKVIGIGKALRFIFFSFYSMLLNGCIVPALRVFLLRLAGAKIGSDTVILQVKFFNLYHYGFRKLKIGSNCFLGDEVMLDTRGEIIIEDEVTISNRSTIVTHINVGYPDHPLQKYYPTKEEKVVIKRGSYIGTGAILLPGITIGPESVVGAAAVVTRNVPKRSVVAGVPARVIKSLK